MIARQPIYNSKMGVFGYELIYCPPSDDNGPKPNKATAQVIVSAILEFGLDQFVNHRMAVINVTRAFLDVMPEVQLSPEQVILNIPDNLVVDAKLPAILKGLRSQGYGISIGGLANLKDRRLLPLATIFRLEVQIFNASQLDALTTFLRNYKNLSLLALSIESLDEYRDYCAKDIEYLHGRFLSKPRIYATSDFPTNKLALLRLLTSIHNLDTPTEDLEQLIANDVSLSFQLLKLVNSPFFGIATKIDSIKQAVVLLGRDEIRKWVSLLALSGMSGEPDAIVEIAALRAKLCELLAKKAGLHGDSYFTVGMFSALDLLMKQPLETVLGKLPLCEEVKAAILGRQGMLGEALSCALAFENTDWSKIYFANLSHDDISQVQREAMQWSDDIMRHH